jgi:hypothetical protein
MGLARRGAALTGALAIVLTSVTCGGARARLVSGARVPGGAWAASLFRRARGGAGGRHLARVRPDGARAPRPGRRQAAAVPLASLVLMLDGVPWAVMDSLHAAGHFRGFTRPSAVLSPFPSLTTVAYRDIWRESPTPGYEDRYFDIAQNRVRGGAWDVLSGREAQEGFHRHVDIEGAVLVSNLAYAFPQTLAAVELKEVRDGIAAREGHDSVLVAYICTTDAMAHHQGRAALVAMLLRIEALVDEVRARHPGLRVDMMSDHGNDFVPSHQLPLEAELARAGFRLTDRLERPGDVVVPRFGLVGSAAFYAAPPDRAGLIRVLTADDGVELATWADGGAVEVEGRSGRARVDADPGTGRLRYTPETGDPLGFEGVRERLRASGEMDTAGFAPDSAWLRESLATPFADALRRLLVAFRGVVQNEATVLVSFAPGGHFGDAMGDRLAHMLGTHGSLRSASSTAFLMSTAPAAPLLLRSDEVLAYLPRAVQGTGVRYGAGAPAPAGGASSTAAQR